MVEYNISFFQVYEFWAMVTNSSKVSIRNDNLLTQLAHKGLSAFMHTPITTELSCTLTMWISRSSKSALNTTNSRQFHLTEFS